jgi:hypothetical protein
VICAWSGVSASSCWGPWCSSPRISALDTDHIVASAYISQQPIYLAINRSSQARSEWTRVSSKQTKIICSLSKCLGCSSVGFGSIEPLKLLKRNNRNKRFVSDSVENSFGSSFSCFESQLVSKDTLEWTEYNLVDWSGLGTRPLTAMYVPGIFCNFFFGFNF